tara:strand:- start:1029 stop:1940 length:912 start_codon:yes stop_codon:yes gene_type:complete
MSNKIILIMGADGMLGKMVSLYFGSLNQYSIVLTSRSESDFLNKHFNDIIEHFDVLNDNFEDFAKKINPDFIVNCVGRIKPTIDEANSTSVSETININSFFPIEIQKYSAINNSRYYQIGTDCVYSGKDGNYNEDDYLDAEDLYGKSKIVGELPARNKHIIRSSIIGPEHGTGRSLLNWFLKNESTEVSGFKNHLWNGVTTLNFAKVIHGLILNQNYSTGLQHLITSDKVTKADLLHFFKIYFDKEININKVNAENIIDRTLTTINNKNNEQLWIDAGYNKVPSVEENIAELSESEFTKLILN